MNDILTKARELGEAIAESEEFKALKDCEELQENDPEAMAILKAYNDERRALAEEITAGNVPEERMAQIRARLEELHASVTDNETIAAYTEAQKRFEGIVSQVNAILTYYMTGELSAGCSGNCSSCGGGTACGEGNRPQAAR